MLAWAIPVRCLRRHVNHFLQEIARDEEGGTAALIAVSIIILTAFVGLSVDIRNDGGVTHIVLVHCFMETRAAPAALGLDYPNSSSVFFDQTFRCSRAISTEARSIQCTAIPGVPNPALWARRH